MEAGKYIYRNIVFFGSIYLWNISTVINLYLLLFTFLQNSNTNRLQIHTCLKLNFKKSPRTSPLVQLSIFSSISGSNAIRWTRTLNTAYTGARGSWQCCTFRNCQWTVWIERRLEFFYCILCFREIISSELSVAGVKSLCGAVKCRPVLRPSGSSD